jgi:hypothetical protein
MGKAQKLTPVMSGIAGEYLVAAELSRRGYIASITLRNTAGVDILCSNKNASKTVAIQVKTNQGEKKRWVLNSKVETFFSRSHFYILVSLSPTSGQPEFHIVPSTILSKKVKKGHAAWLRTPGKNGQPHQDSKVRQFIDHENKYLNKWELLGLD